MLSDRDLNPSITRLRNIVLRFDQGVVLTVGSDLDSGGIDPPGDKEVLDGDGTFQAQPLVVLPRPDAVRMAYDANIFRFAGLNRMENLRNLPFGFRGQCRGVADEVEKKPDRGLRERGKRLAEFFEHLFFLHGDRRGGGDIHGPSFCRLPGLRKNLSSPFVFDDDLTRLPIMIGKKDDQILLGSA